MKNYPPEHYDYKTSNLIVGAAEVPYCHVRGCWVGIDGYYIYSLDLAKEYGEALDKLIRANQ